MPKTIARMMLVTPPDGGAMLGYFAPSLGAFNNNGAAFAGFVVDVTGLDKEHATHALAAAKALASTVEGAAAFQIRGAEHGIPRVYNARGEFVALGASPFDVGTIPGGRGRSGQGRDLGAFRTGTRSFD